jgi:pseudouridine kinase
VSVAKAQRLPNDLETVDLLFLNEDEAGVSFASIKSARAVVVGRGANGVAIVEADAETTLPAAPCDPRDETGAGDALIAATIAALIEGRGLRAGVADGIHRAARTIESADTVVGR